jgi:hypothetical protein
LKVEDLDDLLHVATCSVEEAANLVGISRTKAYESAKTGDFFEIIKIGKRIRVKARPLHIHLMGTAPVKVGHE